MMNDNDKTELFLKHIAIYRNDVFRIIYNIFSDKELAEDLAQLVMLYAWKGFDSLKDIEKSKPWVKMITRNVIRQHMKKKRRDFTVEEIDIVNNIETHEELHGIERDVADILIKQENNEDIRKALEILDPDSRKIICLHIYGEMNFREISEISGIYYSKVTKKYKTGLKRMKDYLNSIEEGGGLNG